MLLHGSGTLCDCSVVELYAPMAGQIARTCVGIERGLNETF